MIYLNKTYFVSKDNKDGMKELVKLSMHAHGLEKAKEKFERSEFRVNNDYNNEIDQSADKTSIKSNAADEFSACLLVKDENHNLPVRLGIECCTIHS